MDLVGKKLGQYQIVEELGRGGMAVVYRGYQSSLIGDLTGQPNVWIALTFESDGSINFPAGAYVDNVLVRKCTSTGCAGVSSVAQGSDSDPIQEWPMQARLRLPDSDP